MMSRLCSHSGLWSPTLGSGWCLASRRPHSLTRSRRRCQSTRTVSLTGEDWLKTGYDLWSADPLNDRRDYMVMEPNKKWTGAKRRCLSPSGLSAAIGRLLGAEYFELSKEVRAWLGTDACSSLASRGPGGILYWA